MQRVHIPTELPYCMPPLVVGKEKKSEISDGNSSSSSNSNSSSSSSNGDKWIRSPITSGEAQQKKSLSFLSISSIPIAISIIAEEKKRMQPDGRKRERERIRTRPDIHSPVGRPAHTCHGKAVKKSRMVIHPARQLQWIHLCPHLSSESLFF